MLGMSVMTRHRPRICCHFPEDAGARNALTRRPYKAGCKFKAGDYRTICRLRLGLSQQFSGVLRVRAELFSVSAKQQHDQEEVPISRAAAQLRKVFQQIEATR